jgi:hypothetical protein
VLLLVSSFFLLTVKLDYEVSIISEFESSFSGHKVVVKIPCPPNTAVCKINVKVRAVARGLFFVLLVLLLFGFLLDLVSAVF